jgi:hypothetical protein
MFQCSFHFTIPAITVNENTNQFLSFVLLSYFNWIYPVVYQVPRAFVVPVNFGLFILGNIWQAILAIDALRMKNILQLYSIAILNGSLFVFSIMRYFQTEEAAKGLQLGEAPGPQPFTHRDVDYWGRVRPALLTSSIVLGASTVISCFMVFFLQRELRWAIYRHISGSLEMLRRYLAYQVCTSSDQFVDVDTDWYRFCWCLFGSSHTSSLPSLLHTDLSTCTSWSRSSLAPWLSSPLLRYWSLLPYTLRGRKTHLEPSLL